MMDIVPDHRAAMEVLVAIARRMPRWACEPGDRPALLKAWLDPKKRTEAFGIRLQKMWKMTFPEKPYPTVEVIRAQRPSVAPVQDVGGTAGMQDCPF